MADAPQPVPDTPVAVDGLDDATLEQVMLLADGELSRDPLQRAAAEQAVAANPVAAAVYQDLLAAKSVLRELVVGEAAAAAVRADLSMVRGRVMSRLPSHQPARTVSPSPKGWRAWFAEPGIGKVSLLTGAAVAVAVALVVVQSRPRQPSPAQGTAAVASHDLPAVPAAADEPAVVIEEIEVDGSLTVNPGLRSGQATVIWHFQPAMGGEG